ncbi:uncharacterized protein G2W53_023272 [Senna tora]|uniref:Uncharacterized protein n=1 Tax=Senna tora TaxID=362788 RepID=A0A834TBH0_9FABA|nr:uncharacterized protein G2W53_023272 [Senna tora]
MDPPKTGVDEASPKPMEESPQAKSKSEEEIPSLIPETEGEPTKSNRRALWGANPTSPQSYKEKLMGVNGRDKDFFDLEDEDMVYESSEEEQEDAQNMDEDFLCPELVKNNTQIQVVGDIKRVEVGEEAFGPWMIVQPNRRRRQKPQNKNIQPATNQNPVSTGSRFEAISNEDMRDMEIDRQGDPKSNQQIPQTENNILIHEEPREDVDPTPENRQKAPKGKQRKPENHDMGSRKLSLSSQVPNQNKKTVRTPIGKCQYHILVTSVGTKNLTTPGSKSQAKGLNINPKAPTKHPTKSLKEREEEDARMEEHLRVMRILEKQEKEAVT